MIIIALIIAIVGACVSGSIAAEKQQPTVPWAALGFFLPLIGVIAVCCVPHPARPSGGAA